MIKYLYIFITFVFLLGKSAVCQINQQEFEITVSVIDRETKNLITDAEVSINGHMYYRTDSNGKYKVRAKIGDDLVVFHPDMQTVYHTIRIKDDIKIYVEDFTASRSSSKFKRRKLDVNSFQKDIDSASFYKTKDIDKSISFIESILKNNPTKNQTASSYELLGDIYLHWKQYDLAEENYQSAFRVNSKVSTQLKLADTQYLLKDFKQSSANYQALLKKKLTSYQQIKTHQGLASVLMAQKKYRTAEKHLKVALLISKANLITPKITDINSNLAEIYAEQGKQKKADKLYQNSLELASKENKKRSLKEQEKVANYYNKSNRYDDEIKLRQQTLEQAEEIQSETIESEAINDTINAQKINYKIANAYILKEEYNEAIPYLEKSIKEADAKEDLVVKKDATRKLSEVYETVGEGDKALETYRLYVALVDKLYVQKQQEIEQAKRFSKKIADNQNRIKSLEKDKELTESKINLAYKDQQLAEESNKRKQIFIYALFVGFVLMSLLAYLLYRNTKQQKLANNLLALKSMRSQMNPHFIFNALNSVNSFIAVNDERNANRYLSEFSVLMRSVLENSDEDFIPLTKEIELLALYTKLEHNRFKNKFDYSISVDDTIPLDAYQIPPMLLQPYVENAIWHGLRYKEEKGTLDIAIRRKTESSIEIMIQDDGIGRKKSAALKTKNQLKQKSKGMSTVKNRVAILNDMYKDAIDVTITDVFKDGTGTKVTVILKKQQ